MKHNGNRSQMGLGLKNKGYSIIQKGGTEHNTRTQEKEREKRVNLQKDGL